MPFSQLAFRLRHGTFDPYRTFSTKNKTESNPCLEKNVRIKTIPPIGGTGLLPIDSLSSHVLESTTVFRVCQAATDWEVQVR